MSAFSAGPICSLVAACLDAHWTRGRTFSRSSGVQAAGTVAPSGAVLIEFGLVLGVNLVGLVFAIVLARWLAARDAGGAELRRLGNALERAAQGFVWGQLKVVLVCLTALAGGVFAVYGFLPGNAVGRIDAGLWAVLGVVLGGVGACVVGYSAAQVAHKASVRCVAATRLSLDRSLSIAIRAGGVAGLLAETISAILVVSFVCLIAGLRGAFSPNGPDALAIADVAVLLPTLALGAGAAGLILQRGGAIYQVAGDVGGELTGERVAGLGQDDPRNPALVAELVGDHVGAVVGRSITGFVATSAGHVAMLVVGLWVAGQNRATVPGALGLALLPLLVRCFGVFASCVGLMVVRTEESALPRGALIRGQVVAWLVALAGTVGASFWLIRAEWWRFAAAGAVGLGGATLVGHLVAWLQQRARVGGRDTNEAIREGASALISHGLGRGLGGVLLPLGLLGLALVGAHGLGSKSGLEHAGTLALLVSVAGVLGPAPFLLGLTTLAPIADNARGIASLNRSASGGDTERRTELLDQAAFGSHSAAATHLLLGGASSVLIAVMAVPCLAGLGGGLGLTHPAGIWSGLLAVGLVLAYSGGAMERANHAARVVGKEVERQLRTVPRGSTGSLSRDFTPAYKICIDLAGKSALEALLRPVLMALAFPLALSVLLRRMYGPGQPSVALQAALAFIVMGTATGLVMALVSNETKAVLATVRRGSRSRPNHETRNAIVAGDAFADVLAHVGGPTAHLLAITATAAVLVAAPFLR